MTTLHPLPKLRSWIGDTPRSVRQNPASRTLCDRMVTL
jgi:hypothetical protein